MRIKLNLNNIVNFNPSSTLVFGFENLTNQDNFNDSWQGVTLISFTRTTSGVSCGVIQNGASFTLNATTLHFLSATDDYVKFDCDLDIYAIRNIETLLSLRYIDLDVDGYTGMILYTQNSENNALEKSLTIVDVISGKFNHSIGVKSLNVDVVNIPMNFNYVYIPSLNRYYYVDSVEIISNDVRRLHLKEDVLMSWKNLITEQNAFITRQENDYTDELFDNRLPLNDVLSVQDVTSNAVDTASGNLTNVTLDFSIPYDTSYHEDCYHILVTSFSNVRQSDNGKHEYVAPSGSGLPNLSSTHNNYQWFTFVNGNNFGLLMKAIINDDVSASYIQSILWLPFDPSTVFSFETGGVYAGDNYLTINGTFQPLSDPQVTSLPCRWATESSGKRGVCPYLIIKDFTYSETLKGINVEPYANYEFFIPFVGWIKVESNKFFNKRILIYYNIDLISGMATSFIYNYTDKLIIWSGTCQIGVKIDTSYTNQLENTRQKQANENNMILSLLTSALSVGVGIATENPVAVVGGVLSGGKAIAGYVNSNNQMFERAQTTFGSGESAMHTNKDFKIRKTYHETIPITQSVYAKMQGYPSNQYSSLNTLSGYTEIGEIHFDPQDEVIYQDEINEIVSLLKDGVIL